MPTISLTVPDELYNELTELSQQLKQTPEEFAMLAIQHLINADTLENALEGYARMEENEALVSFPELKEELGMEMQFHPMAMEELEALEEEDQIEVLGALIARVTDEEGIEEAYDLPICDTPSGQMTVSGFDFGDIVYAHGPSLIVYHIALGEDEEDELDLDYDEEEEEEAEDEEATIRQEAEE